MPHMVWALVGAWRPEALEAAKQQVADRKYHSELTLSVFREGKFWVLPPSPAELMTNSDIIPPSIAS